MTTQPTKDAARPFVQLTGRDGNAFAIMGACRKAAQEAGWSRARIDAVMAAMTSGSYDHLLRVALEHFEVA